MLDDLQLLIAGAIHNRLNTSNEFAVEATHIALEIALPFIASAMKRDSQPGGMAEIYNGSYWKDQAFQHIKTIKELQAKVDQMTILHMHGKCSTTMRESVTHGWYINEKGDKIELCSPSEHLLSKFLNSAVPLLPSESKNAWRVLNQNIAASSNSVISSLSSSYLFD